jgi:hypothetical protein
VSGDGEAAQPGLGTPSNVGPHPTNSIKPWSKPPVRWHNAYGRACPLRFRNVKYVRALFFDGPWRREAGERALLLSQRRKTITKAVAQVPIRKLAAATIIVSRIPIFLHLARDSRRLRIFDFHPVFGSTRAVRRAKPLRYDALAAEPARCANAARCVRAC